MPLRSHYFHPSIIHSRILPQINVLICTIPKSFKQCLRETVRRYQFIKNLLAEIPRQYRKTRILTPKYLAGFGHTKLH
ncbi:Os02g0613300 [Oryza sativa Japonica Group]|uniref:Os02g0613300 protein n=1 Tax=Oryza sativa subsp. japonica TaxID=39947 RepID=A0A0P0VLJ8_ORYSJ|nr:hypothetical protein EE612_012379 [Oryza sativa]BAS79738.1 Os02g0613300 [Oryza sativa Japonica Group]